MTLHHTDFVSTLYAERANILSAQGLLSKRLVALDDLLAVYGAKHAPGEDSIIAHAQPVPEAPTPLPEGGGQRAPTVETRPAEAKTSDQDALSSASGEAQDRRESASPPTPETAFPVSPKTSAEKPGSEAVASDAATAPAGEASRPDASPAPTSTRQRVKQLHDEHPEYTRREAWEALGITEGSLAGHSFALGIKWRPLEPVRFERPAPPPPEDAIAPDETVTPSNGFSAPRPSRPKGTQFRLRAGRGEGKYLHMSAVGMTDNKTYAWIGTEAQMLKLRQKFPDARDLVEEVVEKEPVR